LPIVPLHLIQADELDMPGSLRHSGCLKDVG
jgi:hypothetical protein